MAGTILSADIGTSSLKAAFIDFDGRLLAITRVSYNVPDINAMSIHAHDWESAFIKALKRLCNQAPDCGIDAVCISGNGPTLVPVKRNGDALPPLYWNDGKTFLNDSAPSFFLPHAAWFKNKAKGEYQKIDFFISSHEWLAFRLGAEVFTALPNAAYEPYYWDNEQLSVYGLDAEKFPPFIKTGNLAGKVSKDASVFFGSSCAGRLKSGIPIISGAPDFIVALIGTKIFRPGEVCDRAGSSEGINVCAAERPKDGNLRVLPHVKKGLWNISTLIPKSGRLFDEYRLNTGQQDRPYAELLAELLAPGESLSHSVKPHAVLGRQVLEKMAIAVRSAAEKLAEAGFPVKEMRVSGAQGRNALWNQYKADISGITLVIPEICDAELAGNAVLAASALQGTALEETADKMIRFGEVYRPQAI